VLAPTPRAVNTLNGVIPVRNRNLFVAVSNSVMRHTALGSCALIPFLAVPAQSQPPVRQPLPMVEVEACRITLAQATGTMDFGGRVAVYRVTVDKDGSVATLEVVQRNFAGLVLLDGLEDCVRRWRFGNVGVHTLVVFGGTRAEPAIQVVQGQQSFRLRVHYPDRRP
jgi:hypothetical protein